MRVRKVRRRKVNRSAERLEAGTRSVLPSRFNQDRSAVARPRVAVIGTRLFCARLNKLLRDQESLELVASISSVKESVAASTLYGAELAIVEIEIDGQASGVLLARALMDRSPGCGIMLVCRSFTDNVARHVWVYGAESWSLISGATASNPAGLTEAISSTVRGMTWVEPGMSRVLAAFGPRPNSVEERRLLLLEASLRTA